MDRQFYKCIGVLDRVHGTKVIRRALGIRLVKCHGFASGTYPLLLTDSQAEHFVEEGVSVLKLSNEEGLSLLKTAHESKIKDLEASIRHSKDMLQKISEADASESPDAFYDLVM